MFGLDLCRSIFLSKDEMMTVVCFREKAEDITKILWLASFQGEVYTFNYYKGLKCKDKQTIFSKNEYLRIYMIMF